VSTLDLAKRLTDMAELEQIRARNAEARADQGAANFQAVVLAERDRHIARAGAFLQAAQLALKPILEGTANV
jgi:hypothetical protein